MVKKLTPTISIITVVLNDVAGIKKTINSVTNQTYRNFEFIIVDGGSTDTTVNVIKQYQKYITSWVSEPDKGIYDAMNKGAKKARGEYLYFLNAGDYFYNESVLKKLSSIFQTRDYDLLSGKVIVTYPTHQYVYKPDFLNKLKLGKTLPHQGTFLKRTIFEKLEGYDTQYRSSGDRDFFCRFYKKGFSYKLINDYIAYMPSGGLHTDKSISLPESYKVIKKYFGIFYGTLHYIKNFLIEQNIKNLLFKLGLENLYNKLLKIKTRNFE